jgi:predicted CopG family antitoxin
MSKNISLREESYERLRARKREGESFSDVIDRLTTSDEDVWAGYGAMRGAEGFRTAVEDGHETFEADFTEPQRRLFDRPDER